MTVSERDEWLERAGKRNPPRPTDVASVRAFLKSRDRIKYWYLAHLIRWAEKQLWKQYGFYPEDARWYLP